MTNQSVPTQRPVALACSHDQCARSLTGWHDEAGKLHVRYAERLLEEGWFFAVDTRASYDTGRDTVNAWCPSHMHLAPAAVGVQPLDAKL